MARETSEIEAAVAAMFKGKTVLSSLSDPAKITQVTVERAKGDKWLCTDNGDGTWTCTKQML